MRESNLVLIAYLGDLEMQVLRSFLAGGLMLASVGVAGAAEPTLLTDAQMDGVTAGQYYVIPIVPVQQGQQFNNFQALVALLGQKI
jgi:hypothetical protein